MSNAIEVMQLTKTYRGGVRAMKDIDLTVGKGSCFGLLGPNGAGKSTLVKTLLSIVRPSSGSATILDIDIRSPKARAACGYLPEGHRFPDYLTGRGVCSYFGRLSGLRGEELKSEITAKLGLVNMSDWADTKVTKYSKGMKQRVGLAQSMLGNPPVVFLDEPTDGVDPVGRAELRDAIREYADGGSTVFLNSHILDEVEKVCDQIAILHKGAVIEQGDVEAVKNRIAAMSEGGDTTVTFRTGSMGESTFKGYASRGAARVDDHRFTVSLGGDAEVNQWVDRLRSDGIEIYAIEHASTDLEGAFIELIGAQDESGVGGTQS